MELLRIPGAPSLILSSYTEGRGSLGRTAYSGVSEVSNGLLLCRMGSKSPGNNTQRPAFFSKLTESNSAMVKSKKQEIIKKLSTTNKNETEYSKNPWGGECRAPGEEKPQGHRKQRRFGNGCCCVKGLGAPSQLCLR